MKYPRNSKTIKRKKSGGNNIPLITYTPNYRSLDFTSKLIQGQTRNWETHSPFDTKDIELKIKLPQVERVRVPQELTILFGLEKGSDYEKIQENFKIIACIIIQKIQLGGGGIQYRELIMFDNCGNKYHIAARLPPGTILQGYGVWQDTLPLLTYYYTKIGTKTTVLPDTMIDFLIENEINILGPESLDVGGFRRDYVIIQTTTPGAKPHKKFEPTAELAEYIQQLETKPNTISMNVQTNLNSKINKSQQANLNTEERWKHLCKRYTNATTQKNKNKVSEQMTNLFNRLVTTN